MNQRATHFETLVDIFTHSIGKFPERELFGTKLGGEWRWVTYEDFGARVKWAIGGLSSLGVGPGDVVAMISNNRVEWAVLAYATFARGAALVPMYEAQSVADWEFIARDAQAKVLVVANDAALEKALVFAPSIPSLEQIVVIDRPSSGRRDRLSGKPIAYSDLLSSAPMEPLQPTGNDLACILYTSGTTGNPKGVLLTHSNFASNVSAVHQVFPIDEVDRSLSFLPWAHAFGQTTELHCLFSMGASIAIAESVDRILDNLAEIHPTLLFSVPRIFSRIYTAVQKQIAAKPRVIQELVTRAMAVGASMRAGKAVGFGDRMILAIADRLVFSRVRARFGGRLKYAFSGGAAIAKEVAEFIDTLGIQVYEGYGLTETSPIATVNYPGNRKIGSVGLPLPEVRIEIVPLGAGEGVRGEGEVVVYGPCVMRGYHNRPDDNAAVFTLDGGFRTGDMGRLDRDGYLFLTGRIKEQYKLENGKYVVPTPIEEALKLSLFITNAMVYGDNRPFNIALIVPNHDSLRAWAQTHRLDASNIERLLQRDEVRELIRREIADTAAQFKGFEAIRDFILIADDFTLERGMMTPSLKLKRRNVLSEYGDRIDGLYAKHTTKSSG